MQQNIRLLLSLLFILSFQTAFTSEDLEFPVLYKGRYRPATAYAHLWLYDFYHAASLKKSDLAAFHTTSSSPLSLLWSLDILGSASYQKAPLFWIRSAGLKQSLKLPLKNDRFSYQELQPILYQIESDTAAAHLLAVLKEFEHLQGSKLTSEVTFRNRLAELQAQAIAPKEIEYLLEQEFPFIQRLRHAGSLFKSLPSRYKEGEWFALKALTVEMYHPSSQKLKLIGNFTLFADAHFEAIRQAYFTLRNAFIESNPQAISQAEQSLAKAIEQAYRPLAGKIVQEAHGKQLTYPTLLQLKIETLYIRYPWISLLILLYGIGACLLLVSYRMQISFSHRLAMGIVGLAIFCHTALLAMRCYILGRPPVSNMFETIIYVPWVASCVSLIFPTFRRQPLVLIAACLTSISLLLILEVTDLNQSLDQVQAVLDSQFWLMVHVLLVVGSYGIFILGAILGHFYLAIFMARHYENASLKLLSQMILQTMYGGTALLIVGTILGGIWAAESWGRFWDWDPKESWAFISICFYLIWIHAYRFHRISAFGLAFGAVSGLIAISFTWYGVNYILGTGLHSYGFGSGGEIYYYVFLGAECLFLAIALGARMGLHRLSS